MSELKNIQQAYSNSRSRSERIGVALQREKAALDKLVAAEKKELAALAPGKAAEKKKFYAAEKEKLAGNIDALTAEKKAALEDLARVATDFLSGLDPVSQVRELDDAFPILLFPLRLETRFKQTGSQQQLWLRVYPDDCNIRVNEDLLSESELRNARAFWIEIWKAGGIEAEERAAWKSLVNSQGTGRAAWIIQQYKPANSKPLKPDASYKILVTSAEPALSGAEQTAAAGYWIAVWLAKNNTATIADAFVALTAATGQARANEIRETYVPVNLSDAVPAGIAAAKIILEQISLPAYTANQTSWTQAAKTTALPDKFVVTAYNGNQKRTVLFTRPVKDQLDVSADPSLAAGEQISKDDNGNLLVQENLQWMVDFEKAVEAGMAVKIDLSEAEAANGFDKLFVTGIRFTADEDNGQAQLEKLLTDHFYSKSGFGLLRQGTPTNNTEDMPAGYSWTEDSDESYKRIFRQAEFTPEDSPGKKSDGEKLADCLGIDPGILQNVSNAGGKDQLEAFAMNTALFPATLGYFMEEMMHPLFNGQDIDATRTFFTSFVSGRGPVPAIRIGRQPYGILPISVYSRLAFSDRLPTGLPGPGSNAAFLSRLHSMLMQMDQTWNSLLPGVAYLGKSGDPHQLLLDVLGLHSGSVEFHQRYSQSIQQLYNQLVLQLGPLFAALIAAAIAQRGSDILQQLNSGAGTTRPAILDKYFLGSANLLSGPFIDDVPDSETALVRPYYIKDAVRLNYIEWLAASDTDTIRTENFAGNPAPVALLYLLLRHALLQAQADAATRLLLSSNIIRSKQDFYDPAFISVQQDGGGKSKFEHLYGTYPLVTGSNDITLADYLYKPAGRQRPEVQWLKETIEALKTLEQTPTARLERLLAESLDCCSYRIDAWKTGLVQYKLAEMRNKNQQDERPSKGIYLGAYGWLLAVKPGNKVREDVPLSPELHDIFNKNNDTPPQSDSANLGYIHAPSLNQAATAAILRNAYHSNSQSGTGDTYAVNLTSDRVRLASQFLDGIRNGQSLSALLGYRFERDLHDKYSMGQGEADKFIYPLRKKFPLVADNLNDTLSAPADPIETIEASNVIDGLKLIQHVQTATVKTYPFGLTGLPPAGTSQSASINTAVQDLNDIHDAISDLVISEQVYQVVQGNFERAAGNAEAFSKGSYPPETEVINTPRTGITLTHRMAIQFDAAADPDKSPYADAGGNPLIAMTPRAQAEPAVNAWLAQNLPDPEKVLCRVVYSSPVQAAREFFVSQKDLGLQPIDLLYVCNPDTEQAMNELDDRLADFIRYTVSLHQKTDMQIFYTQPVTGSDPAAVSFFELAALVKSLRKMLIGTGYLQASQITPPPQQTALPLLPDHAELRNRVIRLRDSLQPLAASVDTARAGITWIGGTTADFTTRLRPFITDASKVESMLTQLKADLQSWLVDPVPGNRSNILQVLEDKLNSAGIAVAAIANLKTVYGNYLDNYLAGFYTLDDLVENTSALLLQVALFNGSGQGTGFMNQAVAGAYNSIFQKLAAVIQRWNNKQAEYSSLIALYDPAGNAAEQFALLQKAERLIAAKATFPLPADFTGYKTTIIDVQKNAFDALLNNLKGLITNTDPKINGFITRTALQVKDLGLFDITAFDTETNTNDLRSEKLNLALLTEDIAAALTSVATALTAGIAASETLLAAGDATAMVADKLDALLNAAKKLLGDEALLLPHFMLTGPQANEMENAYQAGSSETILDFVKTLEGRLFPVEDWLGGVARVREKMHAWENTQFLVSAFKPAAAPDITPLQFPYQPADRWLAMKFRDETNAADPFAIQNDKLLYTAHFANGFNKSKPQCGVVVDEWTEVIPAAEETTGVTFHFDQPNSEPPQTMLLAVPPRLTGHWNWEDIVDAMEETLNMAKTRAVEPSQIDTTGYAQFLPATLTAVTRHLVTVATNFSVNNTLLTS